MFLLNSLGHEASTSHSGNTLADRVWGFKKWVLKPQPWEYKYCAFCLGLVGWAGLWIKLEKAHLSGHLVITDQLPTATPCGSQVICRSRMFQPKGSPGAGGVEAQLTPPSWIACAHSSLFRQFRRPEKKRILRMGSQLVKQKNKRDVTLSFLEQFILLTYDINKITENEK